MAIVYMYMYVAVEYSISVPCRMLTAFSSTTIASEKLQLVPDLLHLTTQWKKTELALSVIKGLLHACSTCTCTSTSTFLYSGAYERRKGASNCHTFLVPSSVEFSASKTRLIR